MGTGEIGTATMCIWDEKLTKNWNWRSLCGMFTFLYSRHITDPSRRVMKHWPWATESPPQGQNIGEALKCLTSTPTPTNFAFEPFGISSDIVQAFWLSSLTIVKLQQSAKALAANDLAFCLKHFRLWKQNVIVERLVIPLFMIMRQIG